MSKINWLLAIASLLMITTACSNDNDEPVITTDEANVTFSVNLNDIDSRVISDGTTVDQLIFAVFDTNGNEIAVLRQNDVPVSNCHATVTSRVQLGRGFTFVFWAQKKRVGSLNDNGYYTTTDLKDIVVNYAGDENHYANDENRDAFTAFYSIPKVTKDFTQEITLRRPFAQLDYVCDMTEWTSLKNSLYKLVGTDVTIEAGAYTHYNALTGEASQPTTTPITFALSDYYRHHRPGSYDFCGFATTPNGESYDNLFDGDKFWLSMNYILATPEVTNLSNTAMNIYCWASDEGVTPVQVAPISEVPIQRNHRTVITVSNLTQKVTTTITIDPGFDAEYNY